MSYSVNATFSEEQRKLEGTYPVNMFVINASQSGFDPLYYADNSMDIYGWGINASGNLTATETLYTGVPIQTDDIENNTSGEINAVNISVPNTDRAIESIIQTNNYLRGRDVHVITSFAKHLPSGATVYHVGTSEDKNAAMKEKLYIDSTTSNESNVTFLCKPKFVIKNIVLPRRRFSRECAWDYGNISVSSECRVATTVYASWTTCDKTLTNCEERSNATRFGGWPSIPRRGLVVI